MTNTSHTHNGHRSGVPSLAYGLGISLATTLAVIAVQHFLLASDQPKPDNSRMMMMQHNANHNYLRNHHIMPSAKDLLQETTDQLFPKNNVVATTDKDLLSVPSIWHDEFFSPLLMPPSFMDASGHDIMMFEPAYDLKEDGDQVTLVMSIPDVPLKDLRIEVIGGRIMHITGEKNTKHSHVSFDKRFSMQHLDEHDLKAKLQKKDGKLVVTAPKVGSGTTKDEVRKISIAEEL